jgi:pimeloyl-ACP methyl ester carboxylesterase
MAAGGLAVPVLAGISWYLAGKIRSEALAVEPCPATPAYDDVRFVGLSPGQARLVAIGRQPALSRPELYGITWQGGIGHLGASVAAAGGVVTRPLTVAFGSAPRVGQLAALERAYFLGDAAAALGIPVEHVAIPGPLGPLPAWYFPGRCETFVIGVHGQNGTRMDVLRIVDIVHRMGFPALAVTYRGDRGVTPDPSGYFRYGQTEWRDVEAAVQWSLAHGARRVVLVGQSMGGGIVAAFLRYSPLAAMVARVLFDAPLLDLHAAVDYQVRRHTTPVLGRFLAPLVWLAERIVGVRFGVDWSAISYLDETTWLKVPALVIHGDDDTRVPLSISASLKERQPSLADLAVFPGAGHLESWNTDRARYTSLVRSFLTPVASPAALLDAARSRTVGWCRAVTGVQVVHHRGAAYRGCCPG